jgi:REP element-mobilizing transposase RayT
MPQSVSRIVIHQVFSTSQRVPSLSEDVRARLFPYIGGILREINCQPIQIGGHVDHVHLLFGLSRTLSIAQVTEKVKTATNKWLKGEGLVQVSFAWQKGYAVVSVDCREHSQVVAYIKNQDEHHKKISFIGEYREMLDQSGVGYDEKYIWD